MLARSESKQGPQVEAKQVAEKCGFTTSEIWEEELRNGLSGWLMVANVCS